MDLIDKGITHKVFGEGNIIDQDEAFITVQFDDAKDHNAFAKAIYLSKRKLLQASEGDDELYELIAETNFNQSFSLFHTKYTNDESDRLTVTIDYEAYVIYIHYANNDVQLDIINHTI